MACRWRVIEILPSATYILHITTTYNVTSLLSCLLGWSLTYLFTLKPSNMRGGGGRGCHPKDDSHVDALDQARAVLSRGR